VTTPVAATGRLPYCVLEGGGVKGFALVGALAKLREAKVQFGGYAGTSAGAIVAALAAVGYPAFTPNEAANNPETPSLNKIMATLDLLAFLDGGQEIPLEQLEEQCRTIVEELKALGERYQNLRWWRPFRAVGLWRHVRAKLAQFATLQAAAVTLRDHKGVYGSTALSQWLTEHINVRGPADPNTGEVTFGALQAQGVVLKVVATDVSTGLPCVYGPDEWATFNVVRAVRSSMSIPFFFQPRLHAAWLPHPRSEWVEVEGEYLVDGGMVSNFPANVFQIKRRQGHPVVGIRLGRPRDVPPPRSPIRSFKDFFLALYRIAREAEDPVKTLGAAGAIDVLIDIPVPWEYAATQFNLTPEKQQWLFNLGYRTVGDALKQPEHKAALGLP
jgi:NTE family protein